MSHNSRAAEASRSSSWTATSSGTVEHADASDTAGAGLSASSTRDQSADGAAAVAEGEKDFRLVPLGPVPEWDGPMPLNLPSVPGRQAPPGVWKAFALDQTQKLYDLVLSKRPHLDGPELARLNASFNVFLDALRQAESLNEARLSYRTTEFDEVAGLTLMQAVGDSAYTRSIRRTGQQMVDWSTALLGRPARPDADPYGVAHFDWKGERDMIHEYVARKAAEEREQDARAAAGGGGGGSSSSGATGDNTVHDGTSH